jgi:hypothetical protein
MEAKMSSHKHYVPVLRWKRAEWLALRKLEKRYRKLITPLIEPTPRLFDKEDDAKVDTEIDRSVTNLQASWESNPFFFDTHLISNIKRERYLLKNILRKANKGTLTLIPVTSLNRDTDCNQILKDSMERNNQGNRGRWCREQVTSDNESSLWGHPDYLVIS